MRADQVTTHDEEAQRKGGETRAQDTAAQRGKYLMAAMHMAGGGTFSTMEIQKYLFLLESNIGEKIGGPQFDFKPGAYGPFDETLSATLETLSGEGRVETLTNAKGLKRYTLSRRGTREAKTHAAHAPESARRYAQTIGQWMEGRSFDKIVGAIYTKYPEMKANAVFGAK